MKVILLAAGLSKRLQPIEDKNFLSFLGKPLIQHQIEALQRCGFDDFVVVGGKHNLARLKKLAEGLVKLNIRVVEQKNLDEGMAGAVLSAEHLIKNEPVLIVSSNDIVDDEAFLSVKKHADDFFSGPKDFQKILKKSLQETAEKNAKKFSSESADCLMVAKKVSEYFPGGYLKLAKNGQISGIVEKPGKGREPSDLVNLVIHLHRNPRMLFEHLHKTNSDKDDRYEVALDRMIRDGYVVKALPYNGYWQAVKYPWHVFEVWKFLFGTAKQLQKNATAMQLISKQAQIAKTAVIKGNVIIEDGVKIFDHATIQGPAYIGKNSIIANNSLVREAHIGQNSVVGYSTEIARSYIGDGVWTHSNYIGDSIVGNNTSFGAGCVTGNLRLDEQNIILTIQNEKVDVGSNKFGLVTGENVRVGINTNFMPGVKIGSGSFIGAGISVNEDIPPGKFVYGKWTLTMRDNLAKISPSEREKLMRRLKNT